MGLMDYLKGQFLEIIQWQDDSRDTISFRYPDQDKEIKNGAQLIVLPLDDFEELCFKIIHQAHNLPFVGVSLSCGAKV